MSVTVRLHCNDMLKFHRVIFDCLSICLDKIRRSFFFAIHFVNIMCTRTHRLTYTRRYKPSVSVFAYKLLRRYSQFFLFVFRFVRQAVIIIVMIFRYRRFGTRLSFSISNRFSHLISKLQFLIFFFFEVLFTWEMEMNMHELSELAWRNKVKKN